MGLPAGGGFAPLLILRCAPAERHPLPAAACVWPAGTAPTASSTCPVSALQCSHHASHGLQLAAAAKYQKSAPAPRPPPRLTRCCPRSPPVPAGGLLDRDEVNPVLNGTLPGE